MLDLLSEVEEIDEAPPTEGRDGGYGSGSHSNDEEGPKSEGAQTEGVATSSAEVQTGGERGMTLDLGEELPPMKISASPSEQFYKFTIMDSDSEKMRASDSDSRSNLTRRNIPSPRTRLDILLTELEHVVEESADYFHSSRLSCLKTTDHEIRTDFTKKSSGKIQKLIDQAETLVRRRNRRRKSAALTDDSCDASSEFTESEVEYSSAISDTEYQHPPNLDHSAQTIVNSTPTQVVRRNSSRKRERPRSYQEQGDCERFEMRTYSISEGALADLREMRAKPSRRAPSLRSRTRKVNRSRSESDRLSRSSSDRTMGASGELLDRLPRPEPEIENIGPGQDVGHRSADLLYGGEESDRDLNSTVESFSETAWDDYQDPMYGRVTENYLEEKLDDAHLQWEASSALEFDDELSPVVVEPLQPLTVISVTCTEDSDSDLEEIRHVLNESAKQLQVADSVLQQPSHDHLSTGIHLQPHKYAEVLATCQTNIRCLEDVCQTLEQTTNDVSGQTNLLRFKDMIARWRRDHQVALRRQSLSRQLSALCSSLEEIEVALQEAQNNLERRSFQDQPDMEDYIQLLQKSKMVVSERSLELRHLGRTLETFARENPDVSVTKLSEIVSGASAECARTNDCIGQRLLEVEKSLVALYDYQETSRELHYLLNKEEELLTLLEADLGGPEGARVREDLQTMLNDLQLYDDKMAALRRQAHDVINVGDPSLQERVQNDVIQLAGRLRELKKRCYDNLLLSRPETVAMDTSSIVTSSPLGDVAMVTEKASVATQTTKRREPTGPRYSLMKTLLKLALPIQISLLLIYGILSLTDLAITPQLRYVRGPPPF